MGDPRPAEAASAPLMDTLNIVPKPAHRQALFTPPKNVIAGRSGVSPENGERDTPRQKERRTSPL
jgi:hypothetical protein